MKNELSRKIYNTKTIKKMEKKIKLLGVSSKMDAITFLNLRLLYNISQPLSLLRKILVYTCSICFYALLIIFNKKCHIYFDMTFLYFTINIFSFKRVFLIYFISK